MDSNSTLWCTSSHPLSIHAEVATAAPTTFPEVGYSILSFLMFINTGLSVFNNCLIITVIVRHPSLRQPMNIFILGLAVSHDRPVRLPGCHHHQLPWLLIGHSACAFQGFAVNYFGLVSLWTLTLLAYERYNMVCKPKAGLKLSMQRSIMGLLFVWVFCLFWALLMEVTFVFYSQLNKSVELQGGMVLAMIIAFFVCWLPYTALSVVVVVDPELNIPPLIATVPMYFQVSKVLSCGHYIPHRPTGTSIHMSPLSRAINTHSKVLPL
uniref:G-protein coupled receptors family 1 profile domain-containing protein n=1 Tax=Monopterus albus TaxID=43700 RepID=A0A3Q3QK11_MONAL